MADPTAGPAPTGPAVAATGLRREFGEKVAVASLDLTVPRGTFFGLLGPNGAGKTTTLRMITGLLRPTAGQVSVLGHDVWTEPEEVKRQVGVLPEDLRLFDRLSGSELLTYHGLLRGLPPEQVASRAGELLEVLDLRSAGSMLVIDFSHGMRKKIALAAALIHNPQVLFLDEPFEAIDPVSARTIRNVLTRYTETGQTVVFSSHVLDVVERLCDHVAIVDHGRVVLAGATADVRGAGTLEDAFVAAVGAPPDEGTELAWLGSSSG